MTDKNINWTCTKCGEQNTIEQHIENACFVSLVCEHCNHETEGCYCDFN